MSLLAYNRRLAWVIVPLLLWAWLGLTLALGAGARQDQAAPLHVRLGLPEGGIWLQGQVTRIVEEANELHLTIALPPGAKPAKPSLPEGLSVEYVHTEHMRPGFPDVTVLGEKLIYRLPGDRGLVITDRHLLRFSQREVRVLPRPAELARERLRRFLREQHAEPLSPREPDSR